MKRNKTKLWYRYFLATVFVYSAICWQDNSMNKYMSYCLRNVMPVFVFKCISVSPKSCLMQCLKFQTGCLVGVADTSRYATRRLFQTPDQILFRTAWKCFKKNSRPNMWSDNCEGHPTFDIFENDTSVNLLPPPSSLLWNRASCEASSHPLLSISHCLDAQMGRHGGGRKETKKSSTRDEVTKANSADVRFMK